MLKQQKALTAYEGLSNYWPDANQQQQNYQLLKHKLYDSGLLERYMTDLGFDGTAVKAELKQFAEAERNTLALPEWLATADETKQQLWLGCDAGRCQSTVTLIGISDVSALAALHDLPGVGLGGSGRIGIVVICALSDQGQRLVGDCAFAWLRWAWASSSVGAMALTIMSVPVCGAGGFVSDVGLVRSVVQPVQPVCVVAGVGHRRRLRAVLFMAGDRRASTSLGVTLSALTTLLAFGLLAVSSTEIVHAFGFTVTAGIVTALLCAPLIGLKEYNE